MTPVQSAVPDGTRRMAGGEGGFAAFRQGQIQGTTLTLNGRDFTITEVISEGKTGEADIYLVADGENKAHIFKQYKRDIFVKEEVLETVKSLDHPHVIKVLDYGIHDQSFFELMAYAKGGTLRDRVPIRDLSMLKEVLRQCAEALDHCHGKGLVHRDIKPENLFLRDKKGIHILVADFGIASMVDVELERKVTSRNLTFQYAAPETLTYTLDNSVIIGPPVDYYALGLSLITIWLGRDWYEELPFGAIPTLIVQGDIEIPSDMPEELQDAVAGLLAHNPADRWSRGEIQRWLAGEKVPVARVMTDQAGRQAGDLAQFDFIRVDGKLLSAGTPQEMADLLSSYREQGIRHLYRGDIAEWVKGSDRLRALELEDITKDYPQSRGKAEAGLLKAVYLLDPRRGFIDSQWNEHALPHDGQLPEILDRVGDIIDDDPSPGSYVTGHVLTVFLEANGGQAVVDDIRTNILRRHSEGEISEQKAAMKLILQLQEGNAFRVMGRDYFSFDDLRKAEADVHRHLAKEVHRTDSKFLCWLEGMFLKQNSVDISESETVELLELIKQMPWLREYDPELRARINRSNESGYTDLMMMAKAGDLAACRELVSTGADINFASSDGSTAFATAASAGHTEVMEYLAESGAEINPSIRGGSPLLHELVYEGREQQAAWLLRHGVSADLQRESDGWTPFMVAVTTGNRAMASMLLNAGADVDLLDNRLLAPLHNALIDEDFELAELLLSSGSDVNVCEDIDRAPIQIASRDGKTQTVRFLIDHGANVNAGEAYNRTPLHSCAQHDKTEIVQMLLDAGAKPDVGVREFAGDFGPNTVVEHSLYAPPIYYAITLGRFEMARLLAQAGASMEFSEWGLGYLHKLLQVCKDNRDDCLKTAALLLEKGADPNQGETVLIEADYPEGKMPPFTPLAYAVWQGETQFAKLLLEAGADPKISYNRTSVLQEAVRQGQYELAELLVSHGADVNHRDLANQTALHVALYAPNPRREMVELLLAHGADPTINDRLEGNDKLNPFCVAARAFPPEVLRPFVEKDGDASKAVDETPRRQNPFFWAISSNRLDNLQLLAEAKRGIDHRDSEGYTPLMFAVASGNAAAADILVRAGASKHGKTASQETLSDLALRSGNQTLIRNFAGGKQRTTVARGRASGGPAHTPVGRPPTSGGPLAAVIRLVAAILAIYTYLWAAAGGFFGTPIGGRFGAMLTAAVATNILFWYLFALRLKRFRTYGQKKIKTAIWVGVGGIVVASIVGPFNLLATLPVVGRFMQALHLPPLVRDLFLVHAWVWFHSPSYGVVAELLGGLPVLGGLAVPTRILVLFAALLVALLMTARRMSRKG